MDDVAYVDSSPLIALAAVGRAALLRSVARRIVVPASVEREVRAAGEDDASRRLLREAKWIVTGPETDIPAPISA